MHSRDARPVATHSVFRMEGRYHEYGCMLCAKYSHTATVEHRAKHISATPSVNICHKIPIV